MPTGIGEPWSRHVIGRVFNWIVQAVADPGITDTQCGYRLLSTDAAAALAPRLTIDGFALDVALLYLARCAGFEVREVGTMWHCRRESRVRFGRYAAVLVDVLRVRLKTRCREYADLLDGDHRRWPPVRLDQVVE